MDSETSWEEAGLFSGLAAKSQKVFLPLCIAANMGENTKDKDSVF